MDRFMLRDRHRRYLQELRRHIERMCDTTNPRADVVYDIILGIALKLFAAEEKNPKGKFFITLPQLAEHVRSKYKEDTSTDDLQSKRVRPKQDTARKPTPKLKGIAQL